MLGTDGVFMSTSPSHISNRLSPQDLWNVCLGACGPHTTCMFQGALADRSTCGWSVLGGPGFALIEPVAFAVPFKTVNMMGEPVQQRAGQSF